MLQTKTVRIEFADQCIRAVDHISDIRKAAESASLNLFSRYDVRLDTPMPTANDSVVVNVKIPEEIIESFKLGAHLRGISDYLLKQYRDRYQKHLVGKRLLYYIDVSGSELEPTGIATIDRFEAIADFARLLERSDDEALDQINRILVILNESKQS